MKKLYQKPLSLVFALMLVLGAMMLPVSAEEVQPCDHAEEKWETIPGTPATCIADGTTDAIVCECGEVIQRAWTIKKLGHRYDTVLSHNEFGHGYACLNEGCDVYKSFAAHKYAKGVVCTGEGAAEAVCSAKGCGYSYATYEGEDKTESFHTWGKGKVASCTKHGTSVTVYTCSNTKCKLTHTVVSGDVDVLEATEATCVADGKGVGYACGADGCGKVLVKQAKTTSKTGHALLKDENGAVVWRENPYGHWNECTNEGCEMQVNFAAHTYDNKKDCAAASVCTKAGCGHEKAAGEHIWGKAKVVTCKTDGTTVTSYTCADTGCKYIDYEYDENLVDVIPGEAATCTTAGKEDGYACRACSKVLVKQATIKKRGHNYVSRTAEDAGEDATHNEYGHWTVCTRCEETTAVAAHKYPSGTTCEDRAECSDPNCDFVKEAGTHIWGKGKVATCKTHGSTVTTYTCTKHKTEVGYTISSEEDVELIPGEGATCLASGLFDGWKCAVCDKILVKQATIKKLDHDYEGAEWINEDPTGHYYLCSYECGTQKSFALHNFVDADGNAAVCGEEAWCEVCYYHREASESGGHTWGKGEVTEAVTCVKNGNIHYECLDCDAVMDEPIVAHGHEVTLDAVPATCNSTGLTEGKACSECGKVLEKQVTVKKLPHNYEKNTPETRNEFGHWEECTLCGAEKSFAVHKYATGVTCSTEGAENQTCSCGYSYATYESEDKTESFHIWGKAKVVTCKTDGTTVTSYTCSSKNCKFVHYVTEGNAIRLERVEPTCTESGLDVGWTCGDCGKVLVKQATIKKLGHAFSTERKMDDHGHWFECTREGCDEVNKAEAHKYAKTTSTACGTCEYGREVCIPVRVVRPDGEQEDKLVFLPDGTVIAPVLTVPEVKCWLFKGWDFVGQKGSSRPVGIGMIECVENEVPPYPEGLLDAVRSKIDGGYAITLNYVGEEYHSYDGADEFGYRDLFCNNNCGNMLDGEYPITVISPDSTLYPEDEACRGALRIVDGQLIIQESHLNDGALDIPNVDLWRYNGWQFTAENNGEPVVMDGLHTEMSDELEAWLLEQMRQGRPITMDSKSVGEMAYVNLYEENNLLLVRLIAENYAKSSYMLRFIGTDGQSVEQSVNRSSEDWLGIPYADMMPMDMPIGTYERVEALIWNPELEAMEVVAELELPQIITVSRSTEPVEDLTLVRLPAIDSDNPDWGKNLGYRIEGTKAGYTYYWGFGEEYPIGDYDNNVGSSIDTWIPKGCPVINIGGMKVTSINDAAVTVVDSGSVSIERADFGVNLWVDDRMVQYELDLPDGESDEFYYLVFSSSEDADCYFNCTVNEDGDYSGELLGMVMPGLLDTVKIYTVEEGVWQPEEWLSTVYLDKPIEVTNSDKAVRDLELHRAPDLDEDGSRGFYIDGTAAGYAYWVEQVDIPGGGFIIADGDDGLSFTVHPDCEELVISGYKSADAGNHFDAIISEPVGMTLPSEGGEGGEELDARYYIDVWVDSCKLYATIVAPEDADPAAKYCYYFYNSQNSDQKMQLAGMGAGAHQSFTFPAGTFDRFRVYRCELGQTDVNTMELLNDGELEKHIRSEKNVFTLSGITMTVGAYDQENDYYDCTFYGVDPTEGVVEISAANRWGYSLWNRTIPIRAQDLEDDIFLTQALAEEQSGCFYQMTSTPYTITPELPGGEVPSGDYAVSNIRFDDGNDVEWDAPKTPGNYQYKVYAGDGAGNWVEFPGICDTLESNVEHIGPGIWYGFKVETVDKDTHKVLATAVNEDLMLDIAGPTVSAPAKVTLEPIVGSDKYLLTVHDLPECVTWCWVDVYNADGEQPHGIGGDVPGGTGKYTDTLTGDDLAEIMASGAYQAALFGDYELSADGKTLSLTCWKYEGTHKFNALIGNNNYGVFLWVQDNILRFSTVAETLTIKFYNPANPDNAFRANVSFAGEYRGELMAPCMDETFTHVAIYNNGGFLVADWALEKPIVVSSTLSAPTGLSAELNADGNWVINGLDTTRAHLAEVWVSADETRNKHQGSVNNTNPNTSITLDVDRNSAYANVFAIESSYDETAGKYYVNFSAPAKVTLAGGGEEPASDFSVELYQEGYLLGYKLNVPADADDGYFLNFTNSATDEMAYSCSVWKNKNYTDTMWGKVNEGTFDTANIYVWTEKDYGEKLATLKLEKPIVIDTGAVAPTGLTVELNEKDCTETHNYYHMSGTRADRGYTIDVPNSGSLNVSEGKNGIGFGCWIGYTTAEIYEILTEEKAANFMVTVSDPVTLTLPQAGQGGEEPDDGWAVTVTEFDNQLFYELTVPAGEDANQYVVDFIRKDGFNRVYITENAAGEFKGEVMDYFMAGTYTMAEIRVPTENHNTELLATVALNKPVIFAYEESVKLNRGTKVDDEMGLVFNQISGAKPGYFYRIYMENLDNNDGDMDGTLWMPSDKDGMMEIGVPQSASFLEVRFGWQVNEEENGSITVSVQTVDGLNEVEYVEKEESDEELVGQNGFDVVLTLDGNSFDYEVTVPEGDTNGYFVYFDSSKEKFSGFSCSVCPGDYTGDIWAKCAYGTFDIVRIKVMTEEGWEGPVVAEWKLDKPLVVTYNMNMPEVTFPKNADGIYEVKGLLDTCGYSLQVGNGVSTIGSGSEGLFFSDNGYATADLYAMWAKINEDSYSLQVTEPTCLMLENGTITLRLSGPGYIFQPEANLGIQLGSHEFEVLLNGKPVTSFRVHLDDPETADCWSWDNILEVNVREAGKNNILVLVGDAVSKFCWDNEEGAEPLPMDVVLTYMDNYLSFSLLGAVEEEYDLKFYSSTDEFCHSNWGVWNPRYSGAFLCRLNLGIMDRVKVTPIDATEPVADFALSNPIHVVRSTAAHPVMNVTYDAATESYNLNGTLADHAYYIEIVRPDGTSYGEDICKGGAAIPFEVYGEVEKVLVWAQQASYDVDAYTISIYDAIELDLPEGGEDNKGDFDLFFTVVGQTIECELVVPEDGESRYNIHFLGKNGENFGTTVYAEKKYKRSLDAPIPEGTYTAVSVRTDTGAEVASWTLDKYLVVDTDAARPNGDVTVAAVEDEFADSNQFCISGLDKNYAYTIKCPINANSSAMDTWLAGVNLVSMWAPLECTTVEIYAMQAEATTSAYNLTISKALIMELPGAEQGGEMDAKYAVSNIRFELIDGVPYLCWDAPTATPNDGEEWYYNVYFYQEDDWDAWMEVMTGTELDIMEPRYKDISGVKIETIDEDGNSFAETVDNSVTMTCSETTTDKVLTGWVTENTSNTTRFITEISGFTPNAYAWLSFRSSDEVGVDNVISGWMDFADEDGVFYSEYCVLNDGDLNNMYVVAYEMPDIKLSADGKNLSYTSVLYDTVKLEYRAD